MKLLAPLIWLSAVALLAVAGSRWLALDFWMLLPLVGIALLGNAFVATLEDHIQSGYEDSPEGETPDSAVKAVRLLRFILWSLFGLAAMTILYLKVG